MWKYVSRRIRDTFERSVNHFDRRSTTGVVNSASNVSDDKGKQSSSPCRWFSAHKCWNSFKTDGGTNSNSWNFDQLNRSWIGAITWSSALVVGWYTSQLIHLKYKYRNKEYRKNCLAIQNLSSTLHPYVKHVDKDSACLTSVATVEKVIEVFTPTVYLISNEQNEAKKERINSGGSTSTDPDTSSDDLGDVLNSIENRLGLAAIENGQHRDGLNMLRSAANRNHAPALYNLGLCYEIGLGVPADEKAAMELYRSAAALEHPGALYNLGIYYGQGRGGLARDIETATRLLKLAAVQGQQDAIKALKSLDIEPAEHPKMGNNTWKYQYTPHNNQEGLVPSSTNLFVENVNYYPQQQGYSFATVY